MTTRLLSVQHAVNELVALPLSFQSDLSDYCTAFDTKAGKKDISLVNMKEILRQLYLERSKDTPAFTRIAALLQSRAASVAKLISSALSSCWYETSI